MKYVKGIVVVALVVIVGSFVLSAFGFLGGEPAAHGADAGNSVTRGLDWISGFAGSIRDWANKE